MSQTLREENDDQAEKVHCDVAIIGGGLAGLTLARQVLMQRPEASITIIEKKSFPVPEASHKVGESTVEIGAHYLGERLKLKKHLVDQHLPKLGLRFFFSPHDEPISAGTEVGTSDFFPAPGYQVDRGRLENYLAELVQEMGAKLIPNSHVRQIEMSPDLESSQHRIDYEQNNESCSLECRWLIDASGRQSFLKRKLNLAEEIDHNINAVWFRLDAEIRVDEWCDEPEWGQRTGRIPRRWLSTNHLLGSGYWVWIIPLSSGATSLGIVFDPRLHQLNELNRFDKALAWLHIHEPECAARLEPHREKLKDFMAMKRLARGCRQVFSKDRWALTGEAGVFLDPFYSPGIDYIAIGNTMITELITSDLSNRPVTHLAPAFQSIFMTLFQNNLLAYQEQYPLFGNPRIMSLKYVWDYALYWSFPALLYFQDKLTEPAFIQSLSREIEAMRALNVQMQQFFREWHDREDVAIIDATFVDQRSIEILIQLNGELSAELDDKALKARFVRNVEIIKDLMLEITSRIGLQYPELTVSEEVGLCSQNRLDRVFEAMNL